MAKTRVNFGEHTGFLTVWTANALSAIVSMLGVESGQISYLWPFERSILCVVYAVG